MKKILNLFCVVVMAFVCCFTLVGCGDTNEAGLHADGKLVKSWAELKEENSGAFTISGKIIGNVGDTFFTKADMVGKLIIDDSITEIGDLAFKDCTDLTEVVIPSSVKKIGSMAFYGCTGLTSIKIPSSVTSIGVYAFCNCTGLTGKLSLSKETKTISAGAFANCRGLTTVSLSSETTQIADELFANCTGLTSINIPSSVTSIGDHAFSGCTGLTSIKIPKKVTKLEDAAFSGCTNLKTVYIESAQVVENYKGASSETVKANLLNNAQTVYIAKSITLSSSALTEFETNYIKSSSSDLKDYTKWTKK